MRNAVIAFVFAVGFASPALSQHEPVLDEAGNNIADPKSLQRGAKYFVN